MTLNVLHHTLVGFAGIVLATAVLLGQDDKKEPSREKSPLAPEEQMSPDGVHVLTKDREKRTVAIRNLRDGTSRVLLQGDASTSFGSLLWSRDGKRVAYSWCYTQLPTGRCSNPKTQAQMELRIINVDGTGVRVILPRLAARLHVYDWSADGSSILAEITEADGPRLAVVSIADGSIADLKTGGDIGHAAFSPDGRFVVYGNWQDVLTWGLNPFESDAAAKNDIHVVPVHGGNQRILVEDPADEHFIGWTPHGSLLFTSDRSGTIDLWSAPFHEGRLTAPAQRLATDVGAIELRAALSNGDMHYYSAEHRTYTGRLARLDARDSRELTSRPILARRGGHQGPLRFSPAGSRGAYLAGQDVFDTVVTTMLQSGAESRTPLNLGKSKVGGNVATQLWLTDNEIYIVTAGSLGSATKQFARVDMATGALEPLGATGNEAILWPDGKSVAYVRGSPGRVMRRSLDGKDESEVFNTGTGGRAWSLSVSPDGTRIAIFTGKSANGRDYGGGELRVVDTVSRESRVMAAPRMNGDSVQRTTWSPDGRWVYYVSHPGDESGGEELWRVPASGGSPERVLTHGCRIFGPTVHPSGAFLTFASECVSPEGTYVLRGVIPPEERTAARPQR